MTITKEKYRKFLESQLMFLDEMIPSESEKLKRMELQQNLMRELYWLNSTLEATLEEIPECQKLPIEIYTHKELCDEIIRRVQLYGTAITGDLVDQLEAKRNMELLQDKRS